MRGRRSRRARAAGAAATMVAGAASLSMRGMGASLGCRAVTGAVPGARAAQVVRDDHRRRRRVVVGRRGHGHRAARPERRRQDHHRRVPRGAAAPGCRFGAGARRRPVARGARPPGPGRRDAPGGRAARRPAGRCRCCATSPRCTPRPAPLDELVDRLGIDGVRAARRCGGCPVGSASGWPWPPPCSPAPTCSSSTSRPPGSTRTRRLEVWDLVRAEADAGRLRRGDHALLRGGRAAGRPGRHHGRRAGSWPTARSTRCAAAAPSRTSTSR